MLATRFPLGQVLATPGALAAIEGSQRFLRTCLDKHARGEWGDVCREDADANEWALDHGARLMSIYPVGTDDRIWVITEADRSSTTVLLPEEY